MTINPSRHSLEQAYVITKFITGSLGYCIPPSISNSFKLDDKYKAEHPHTFGKIRSGLKAYFRALETEIADKRIYEKLSQEPKYKDFIDFIESDVVDIDTNNVNAAIQAWRQYVHDTHMHSWRVRLPSDTLCLSDDLYRHGGMGIDNTEHYLSLDKGSDNNVMMGFIFFGCIITDLVAYGIVATEFNYQPNVGEAVGFIFADLFIVSAIGVIGSWLYNKYDSYNNQIRAMDHAGKGQPKTFHWGALFGRVLPDVNTTPTALSGWGKL